MAGVDRGCLVVADISGYTRFLRGVELQHSSDVLADLIGVVVDQLSGVTMLAKLEGDAAFCFERSQCNGPALMTAMASCYGAFCRRIRDITHLTTCECAACREIPRLDLKMVVHYGEFVVHKVAGSEELIGPDTVNTLPPATLEAFKDHGRVARTIDTPEALARAQKRLGGCPAGALAD